MAGCGGDPDRGRRGARATVRTDRAGFDLYAGAGLQSALLHGRSFGRLGTFGRRSHRLQADRDRRRKHSVSNRQQTAGLLPADRGGEVEGERRAPRQRRCAVEPPAMAGGLDQGTVPGDRDDDCADGLAADPSLAGGSQALGRRLAAERQQGGQRRDRNGHAALASCRASASTSLAAGLLGWRSRNGV